MTTADWIQSSIALFTFIAIIVALFGQRLWRWKERPVISVIYDENSERCNRMAIVPDDTIQDEHYQSDTSREYFRLCVSNIGKSSALKLKVKAELFDESGDVAERFEPTLLNWVGGLSSVDLSSNEDWYVDLVSQATNSDHIERRLRIEIADKRPRGIAWDRPLQRWNIRVSVFGENIQEVFTKDFEFYPPNNHWERGILKERQQ